MRIRNSLLTLAFLAMAMPLFGQAVRSPAQILLDHSSQLKMTAEQQSKLKALDSHYRTEVRPASERLATSSASARRLSAIKTPTAAQKTELANDRAEMRKEAKEIASFRRTNREEAMKVLTPAQRTQAEKMMKERAAQAKKSHRSSTHQHSGSSH